MISSASSLDDWIADVDRGEWYYWPTLRSYLLGVKNRPRDAVNSLDDASDKVLRQLRPPTDAEFDIRGLVLGYVQSGKTANFAAVIAKAADAGYRLIIVMSGVDNGLRRQTQNDSASYPIKSGDSIKPDSDHGWCRVLVSGSSGETATVRSPRLRKPGILLGANRLRKFLAI